MLDRSCSFSLLQMMKRLCEPEQEMGAELLSFESTDGCQCQRSSQNLGTSCPNAGRAALVQLTLPQAKDLLWAAAISSTQQKWPWVYSVSILSIPWGQSPSNEPEPSWHPSPSDRWKEKPWQCRVAGRGIIRKDDSRTRQDWRKPTGNLTHTHTLSHTLTHAHSHTHTLTHTFTYSHRLTYSYTLTYSHTLTHTHIFTYTHTCTLSHTHNLTHTFTYSHTLTYSHTYTLTLTYSHTLTL